MKQLIYNACALQYEVLGVKTKPLSDLDKERVCLIEDINKIQVALGKGPLTPDQFEEFMKSRTLDLELIVHDQSALLNRAKYEQTKAA